MTPLRITRTKLANFATAGLTLREAADRLNQDYQNVYHFARRHGIVFPRKASRWLRTLPPNIYVWLAKQTPPGVSLEEFVCSFVVDAYHAESDMAAISAQTAILSTDNAP